VPGLTLTIDLWDIERTGVVAAPTTDQVLAREASGTLLPGEVVERDAGGFITRVIIPNQNLGAQTARGVDLSFQYIIPTEWGTFTWLTQATYLDEFLFPQFHPGNLAGRTTDEGASNEGYYKWLGTSRIDWNWNHFDIVGTARYIDGFHEHTANLREHYVGQTWLFDVQASYDFNGLFPPPETPPVPGYSKDAKDVARGKDGKATQSAAEQTTNYGVSLCQHLFRDTTLTIGCNNVFGQDPPKASGEGGNGVGYPGFTYDATGRFVYVQLTKKF